MVPGEQAQESADEVIAVTEDDGEPETIASPIVSTVSSAPVSSSVVVGAARRNTSDNAPPADSLVTKNYASLFGEFKDFGAKVQAELIQLADLLPDEMELQRKAGDYYPTRIAANQPDGAAVNQGQLRDLERYLERRILEAARAAYLYRDQDRASETIDLGVNISVAESNLTVPLQEKINRAINLPETHPGNGIVESVAAADGSTTLGLGPLTADWSQTGAYDLVLANAGSEMRMLESSGDTYYGTLDVGDLSGDATYTLSGGSGTVITTANYSTALSGAYLAVASDLADLSSASAARTNLGLGSAATQSSSAFLQPGNNLSDVSSASTARTNLGLGSIATQSAAAVAVTGGSMDGTTIGGTTAAAGTFTVLTATGDAVLPSGSVDNAELVNSSVTVSAGAGLADGGSVTLGSSVTINVAAGNGGITVNPNNIAFTVAGSADALSSTTSSGSGLEVLSVGAALLQGCANDDILKWNESSDAWYCAADAVGVVGALSVSDGGTGATSFTANGLLYGNGTSALQATAAGTSGQILVANASSVPEFVTVSGDATITAAGVLTIASGAVTSSHIANGTITGADIASGTISNSLLANSTIGLSVDSSGSDVSVSGSPVALGDSLTLHLPSASGSVRGLLTSANWSTFNAKQDALGYTPEDVANKSTVTSLGTSNTLYPTQNAVKTYVDNLSLGLNWQNPVELINVIGDADSPVGSPVNLDAYILNTDADTGAWSGFSPGDLVQYQSPSWVLIKSMSVGDWFGVAFRSSTTPSGSMTGKNDYMAQITGGTAGAYTYTFTAPENNDALFVQNENAYYHNVSFTYSDSLAAWVQLSATVDFTFSNGFTITGTTVDLGPLTADWSQTGAYDIVLANASSELRLLESSGGTYYGTLDVGDLSADATYTFAGTGGTVIATGNISDITGLTDTQISNTLTASILIGSGSVTDAVDLATAEVAGTLAVGNGGTGATSLTGILIGNGASAFSATTASSGISGQLTDETGSGALVFGTSPAITTSLTTGSASFSLLNTTATTVDFAGAATALSLGASSGTSTVNNNLAIGGSTGLTFTGTGGDIVFANGEKISNDTDGTISLTDGTNVLLSILDQGAYGMLRLSDKGGAGDPATCTAGEVYFNGTDSVFKGCTATNTWKQLDNSSSGSSELSGLTAATGTNSINSAGFAQTWQWNSLSSASALTLSSTSTAAASNTQTLLNIALSGANATSTQTTYGAQIANTHSGTSSTNVGLSVSASGGTNNYGLLVASGKAGIGTSTPARTLDVVGNVGGNTVNDAQSLTSSSTVTESTAASSYFLSNNSGTTDASVTTTFNITGLPDTDGTFAFIELKAQKGITAAARTQTVILQVNGTQVSSVATANSAAAATLTKNFTLVRMNSSWKVIGATGDGTGSNASASTVKTQASSVSTTSTTLQNTDLYFNIGANETWSMWVTARASNTAAADDVKYAVTAPSGASCYASGANIKAGSAIISSTCGASIVPQVGTSEDLTIFAITIVNGSTAGAVQFQYASNTGSGTASFNNGSYMISFRNVGADLAEMYYTTDDAAVAGAVVALDSATAAGAGVVTSGQPYDPKVVGVVTTQPGMVMGQSDVPVGTRPVYVALSGRTPVKATDENGPIRAGDYLTASSTPGHAMKATRPGMVIGQALTDLPSGSGQVLIFIKNMYTGGTAEVAPAPDDGVRDAIAQLTASTAEMGARLDVQAGQIAALSAQLDALQRQAGGTGDRLTALELDVQRLAESSGLTLDGQTISGLTVVGLTARERLEVQGDLEILGRPYFDADTGGYATIRAGDTQARVEFARPFAAQPVVTVSPAADRRPDETTEQRQEWLTAFFADRLQYLVTDKDASGFTIQLDKPAALDMQFTWIALEVRDGKTAVSAGDTAPVGE